MQLRAGATPSSASTVNQGASGMLGVGKHLVLWLWRIQPAIQRFKIHRASTSSGGLGRRSAIETAVLFSSLKRTSYLEEDAESTTAFSQIQDRISMKLFPPALRAESQSTRSTPARFVQFDSKRTISNRLKGNSST